MSQIVVFSLIKPLRVYRCQRLSIYCLPLSVLSVISNLSSFVEKLTLLPIRIGFNLPSSTQRSNVRSVIPMALDACLRFRVLFSSSDRSGSRRVRLGAVVREAYVSEIALMVEDSVTGALLLSTFGTERRFWLPFIVTQ